MKIKEHSMEKCKAQYLEKMAQWWPAIKGSLALVNKPCIRKGCELCQKGKKHPAYIYSYSSGGKRHCLYVPVDLVPLLKEAIKNGRQLEKWLFLQGPVLIKSYRNQRDSNELSK